MSDRFTNIVDGNIDILVSEKMVDLNVRRMDIDYRNEIGYIRLTLYKGRNTIVHSEYVKEGSLNRLSNLRILGIENISTKFNSLVVNVNIKLSTLAIRNLSIYNLMIFSNQLMGLYIYHSSITRLDSFINQLARFYIYKSSTSDVNLIKSYRTVIAIDSESRFMYIQATECNTNQVNQEVNVYRMNNKCLLIGDVFSDDYIRNLSSTIILYIYKYII